ncbi:uncharacterized protein LOC122255069 [Penaeus japonicus]|uniref:uncharacterized protein LOC122255069 n=1 Tax=Penaeus japonicus TaxID=27405 RepID=UPI001C714A23|nr:uncharacterized protein LOC122255069 [Penaeus japonicus]
MRSAVFFILALAGTSLGVPAGQRNTCSDHCDANNIFAYEAGKSYVYEYSVTTSTALLETLDDDAHLHIAAHAHIDVSAPCEYILRLTDVNLDGSSHGPEFAAAVTKSPLRFSFQDGRVENVCSEVSEPAWVLNFKRGVLSTFQNTMTHYGRQDVKETDISGVCMTHYNATVEGSTVTIDKITDLASCTQRPDVAAFIPSTGYITDSPVQNLPIFSSTNECHQRVEEGLLKTAECEEIHAFRPFSSEKGGAVTTAKSTLILMSQEQLSPVSDFDFNRNTLVFEHIHSTEAQLEAVEEILSHLEAASQSDIRPEVPSLFSKLVTSLKELSYPQLNTVYNNAKGTHTRKFLADAMPLVGTAAAFGVVRDMFINGDITEFEADVFFTSLAFFKNPTAEMFSALAPMLENNPSQKALLGSSALINTFCKTHEHCDADSSIQQIIRQIETQLGSSCRTVNEEEKTRVLVALKALGNAGRWVNANSILRRCYTEDNDMEVRVAAIEAWRHTPCEYDRSHLLAAFQDETQDTEVRIAAYLALMTCPTPDLINIIKDRLTSEGVNQVGSFIWTHMTNMQESAAPEKQWVREMIGEELLQKKFSTEALKFSRNYESSFFMNEINTGATIESNVIFSRKSYLPRSAMLNLTLDLFGQSINFFEVGGRIEGFEAYIERFFGPSGYYPEETIENIVRNMRQNSDADATTLEGFLDKITDEPEGSYYLRVFGNELHYHHFQGLENLIQTSGASNLLEFIMDLARKGEVDYTKSYQLIDTHHTIPTITGLPVTLTAKGTATLGLKMNGNFKARSLKNVNIEGHLHPSAAVHIDGLMLVDAHVTHTGLKMSTNLHTSTYLDGKLQINGGKLVDVAINTPKDKMEIISVKSEFFYLEDDQEIRKEAENLIEAHGCTSGIIGVAACGGFGYTPRSPNSPSFPFSGPFSTNIYLKKTDTQTGYAFHYSKEENHFTFEFDTPESQSDHKLVLDITKSGNNANFNIRTPFKSAEGTGEYIWQRYNKNIKASINIDGSGDYSVDAGFHTARNGLMKFEPHVILTSPTGELLNLQSSFESKFGYTESFISSKIDAEYSIWQSSKQTIHHEGLLKTQEDDELKTYTLQFKMDSSEFPFLTVDIDGMSKISSNAVQSSAAFAYPYYHIDSKVSQELEFAIDHLKSKSELHILPQKEYSLILNLEKQGYMDVKGNVVANFDGFTSSVDVTFHGTSDAEYKLQVNSAVNGENYGLEATLKNNSVPGKINGVLDGKVNTPKHNAVLHLGVYADKDKASGDFKSTVDGKEYSVMIETTRTSILVDAKIIKHIFINAYVTSTSDMQKLLVNAEWDKDVDPTKSFTIDGQFSTEEIHAIIKYGQKEVSAIAKLIDNGVELETKWAADKRIFVNVHYRLGNTKSLAATVQTPFLGWEKQDATFSFSIKNYEVESRFAATWRNTEQLALIIMGKVEPGLSTNALITKITFTSAFDNFERITFSLDHHMVDSTINTHLEGAWNQEKIEGNFQLTPNTNGVDARATFTSPVTENILVTLHHELLNQQLSTTFEVKYGQEITTATIVGHVDLGAVHDITVDFKVDTPVSTIPEINANLKYSLSGESLNLVTEGKIGEKKIMLNVNGQMTVSGDTTDISGDMRFITPFMYPLTASLKHTHDMQHFISQFEMTRIWSTYGDIKVHAQGHMVSKNDIELNFDLQSPVTKASASLNHKISQDKILTSTVIMTVNGEQIKVSANGHVDTTQVADLQAEVTSTLGGIDDVKVNLETLRNGNTQITKAVLTKDERTLTINHQITFDDWFNWENSFTVNQIYKLINKQTHVGSVYTHDLEYVWESQSVHFTGSFDMKKSGNYRQIVAHATLSTPWAEDMKLDINHQDDGNEFKPTLIFEYRPGMKIELANILKSEPSLFFIESSLITPFWQPLGFKLKLNFQPYGANLVLTRGSNKTTIDVTGIWNPGMLDGQITVASTYISNPISVKLSYNIENLEFHFIVDYIKTFELSGNFSGYAKKAKWTVVANLPLESVKNVGFSGNYDVEAMPFNAKGIFTFNSKDYQVEGKINTDEFLINVNLDGKIGSLTSKWHYEQNYADIEVKFQSPFTAVDNMAVSGMYDFRNEKRVTLKLTRDSQEINLSGRLEGQTLVFEGTTPFNGWERLNASFFISSSAIKTFVARNDRKIEVTGTLHVKKIKGKVNLVINTPYSGYETISVDTSYNFQGPEKMVEFKATFSSQELSLKGNIKTNNILAPEMTLNIITPFEVVRTLGGEAHWDLRNLVKVAEVKAFRNDRHYHWQLEAAAESDKKGYAKSLITTPISGWTTVNIEGNFDFSSMPSKIMFTFDKEGVVQTFEGHATIDSHNILAEISTPITNWEKITLGGNFNLENEHFQGSFELTKGSEKYNMETDITFNPQMPKFHIKLQTPLPYAANLEFDIEAELKNTEKKFHTLFKTNDVTYSLDLTGEQIYKTGFFKIASTSPVPGYTSVDVYAKYDFTGDIKTSEADLKIEGNNKHFSLALQVNENNFILSITTPFRNFETVKMEGDLTYTDNKYRGFAVFENSAQKFEFESEVDQERNSVTVKLSTPIATFENIELHGQFRILDHGVESSVSLKRNAENFAFNTRVYLSPMKTDIHVALDTPVDQWKKMALDFKYDILSVKKTAEVSVQKDSFHKEIYVEGSYNLKSGSFKIKTPIEGFEILGGEYTLDYDANNHNLEVTLLISQNSNKWNFSAYGHYDVDQVVIRFQTPFEHFETIAIEGNINFNQKTGKGAIQFGSYKFTTAFSYSNDNLSFELTTPFSIIKIISASVRYNWTVSLKDIHVTITYNNNTYHLNGSLQLSTRASDITFEATTPFVHFQNLSLKIKYDIDNKEELVSVYVTTEDHQYRLAIGGYIEEKVAFFKYELKSPFTNWTDDRFVAKLDLTNVEKTLEIILVRNGDVKAISVSGKLIGNTVDFNLKTPLKGLENLKLFGSLNRSKRSLEFMYQQDEAQATLLTSFNSMKLHLKTPFEIAEEITWEISKVNDHTFKAEWKRNTNHVTIIVKKDGNAYKVDLDGEMQAWVLLTLTGNDQTVSDEDKIKLSGSATFDVKGVLSLHIETPFENYKTIDGNLDYKGDSKTGKVEISSSSSNFHFIFDVKESNVEGHLTVPHTDQDTDVIFNFSASEGKVTVKSAYEPLANIYIDYHLNNENGFKFDHTFKVNDEEVSKVEFVYDAAHAKADFDVTVHISEIKSSLHITLEPYTNVEFLFKYEGTVEKHFKVIASGTGDLPQTGKVDVNIENTFRETPRVITVHVDVDRSGDPKKLKIEVTPEPNHLYAFDVNYNADLQNPKHGDFTIDITTPGRVASPWQHLAGNWNIENQDEANISFKYGENTYTATGKLTLQESNIVITSSNSAEENIILEWHFESEDYFLKFGRVSNYVLLKLKVVYPNPGRVNLEGSFRAGFIMAHEFAFTSESQKDDGKFKSEGTFTYGDKSGNYHINDLHYDSATKSAAFEATFSSNISGMESVSITSKYDFDHKFVIHGSIKFNGDESKFDINIAEVYPETSHSSIELNIPVFSPEYRHTQFTFGHDFSNDKSKSLTAVAKFGESESYVKVNWNQSENLDTVEGSVEIKSFLGEIHISASFDLSNHEDMHAEVKYSRTLEGQTHEIHVKWSSKVTSEHFETSLNADSSFNILQHVRVHVTADYSDNVHLVSGLEWNDKKIKFVNDITKTGVSVTINTPFENFELVEAKVNYDLAGETKKVDLSYKRGDNEVNMEITFNITSETQATLDFKLTTPLEVMKVIHIGASIEGQKAHVEFQRNDDKYSLDGDVDFKSDKSSVDMTFTSPEGKTIKIAASYDIEDFLAATGTAAHKLASIELQFEEHNINLNFNGYRNNDRLNVDIHGESSFDIVKKTHLKIDTALHVESHDSNIEMQFNDFEFAMHNHFEKVDNDHYKFKIKLESTLTPLPSLTIGFGREESEYSVTVGYGGDSEITFSIEGKDNYGSGFGGKIDLPTLGIRNVEYEIEYEFENDHELHLDIEVELGEDKEIEAKFVYDSEGLKARFNSLITGEHSVRVRRSISAQDFSAEVALDDYSLKLRGGFNNEDTKYGALLEGEIFGHKFLFDSLFQSEGAHYSEGRLIILTPFQVLDKIGGLFTWSNVNNKIEGHTEIYLPSYTTPKFIGEVRLDLNEKIKGQILFDLSGQKFIFKTDLVGSSLQQGYQGSVEIFTPFHALSHVSFSGSCMINGFNSLASDFKLTTPFGTHEVVVKYTFVSDKVSVDLKLNSEKLAHEIHTEFTLEGYGTDHKKIIATVNENHVSLDVKHPSPMDLEGKLIVTYHEQLHTISGKMNIMSDRLHTELEVESGLFNGKRNLKLDFQILHPNYQHVSLDVALTTSQTYAIHFDLDVRTGFHATVKIDTPIFPVTTATLNLAPANAELIIETPTGTHKVKLNWRMTYRMPADYLMHVEVSSPLFPVEYSANVAISGEWSNMRVKVELQEGSSIHLFEGAISSSKTKAHVSVTIMTPYKNIKKIAFETSLDFSDDVELNVMLSHGDVFNTLDVTFNKNDRSFIAEAKSPYIPTGQASAEAKLTGNVNRNMQIKLALKTGQHTISGTLNVKVNSVQDIEANLKVLTPFKGYKKITFHAFYTEDDMKHILVYTNKPLNYRVELHFGDSNNTMKSELTLVTPFENFENIQAKLEVPLNTFAPSIATNVYVNGASYGGNFGLRTKAPYELTAGYHAAEISSAKFHIRTDSSFISLFA